MKTIKWGIIGTGDVMEVKSGPGLYKAEHSKVVAIYNRSYDKAVDYAKRHHIDKVYKNVSDLIEDHNIEVVYIATPPVSHKDYALQVLEAGKIPYIEKPLAMNYEEVKAIKELADLKGLPVYVAYYRRGLEKFIKIKEVLDSKLIGQVKVVKVNQTNKVTSDYIHKNKLPWRVKPEISGGGLFMDIGSHVLDCLEWYFGQMESMEGYACNTGGYYEAEDTVVASFRFKSGIVGSGSWCFVADQQLNEVEIIGEKGRIVYDGLSAKNFQLIMGDEVETYTFQVPQHIAMPYEVTVINELLGMDKSYASFEEAVNLAKMMDGVLSPYYGR